MEVNPQMDVSSIVMSVSIITLPCLKLHLHRAIALKQFAINTMLKGPEEPLKKWFGQKTL